MKVGSRAIRMGLAAHYHVIRPYLPIRVPSLTGESLIHKDLELPPTYIKGIVNQVLRDAGEHVKAADDVVYVVVYVGQIDFGLVAHETFDLARKFSALRIDERCTSVNIVSAQTVHKRLDWFKSALMKRQVAGHDMH